MSIWLVLGIILLLVSGGLFLSSRNQETRSFSLKSARPTTVAELQQTAQAIASEIGSGNWQDYVRLQGQIHADPPLMSELKQLPCVHYTMKVLREYEETVTETDAQGEKTTTTRKGSESLSAQRRSQPFFLQDETGEIEVNPADLNWETIQVLDEFQPGEPPGGLLSFGDWSLTINPPTQQRRTVGYRYLESIVPVGREALIFGMITDSQNKLLVQKPLNDRRYILSFKTYEALTQSADQSAKGLRTGTIVCGAIGAVLVLIGLVA